MKGIRLREERGAATVEFAVIAGFVFLIVFGIIEFGLLLFNQHVLTNASREGARAGVVMRSPRLSDGDIKAIIIDSTKHMVTFGVPHAPDFGPWPGEPIEEAIEPLEASRVGNMFGKELRVTVKYEYDFLFFPWKHELVATTRMRME